MDNNRRTVYHTLMDVETKNAYSNIAVNHQIILHKPNNVTFVRELTYGVLENKMLLDYIIDAASGPFTKAYVQEHAPDIAAITIQNHLQQRMAEGTITKIGRTKGACYVRAI